MDVETVAAQLRKPDGELGKQMALSMNKGNLYINEATIEALDTNDHDNILEIGMGNGFFVKDILAKADSVKYTGFDYSETMVEEAIKLNEEFTKTGQATFIMGAANHLPFADSTFDKAFGINTIYFLNDPYTELAELHRVLKHNGKLLIALRPKHSMQYLPIVQFGFTLYDKNDVEELLSKHGFNILNVIEKTEPDQERNGESFRMDTLIIIAEKP